MNIKNVFLDLGTHEGQGLSHFINSELNINHEWEIHIFEPNPLIDIEKCIKKFPNLKITAHRKAVWIRNGKIIFKQYGSQGISQGSLLDETNGWKYYADYYDQTEVESIDFSEFLKSFDSNCQLYIKMDIEWAEYEVLKYMLEMGWPQNIKKIWVEWHGTVSEEFRIKSDYLIKEIKKHKTKVQNWH